MAFTICAVSESNICTLGFAICALFQMYWFLLPVHFPNVMVFTICTHSKCNGFRYLYTICTLSKCNGFLLSVHIPNLMVFAACPLFRNDPLPSCMGPLPSDQLCMLHHPEGTSQKKPALKCAHGKKRKREEVQHIRNVEQIFRTRA